MYFPPLQDQQGNVNPSQVGTGGLESEGIYMYMYVYMCVLCHDSVYMVAVPRENMKIVQRYRMSMQLSPAL